MDLCGPRLRAADRRMVTLISIAMKHTPQQIEVKK
jgi:hypothetical protein